MLALTMETATSAANEIWRVMGIGLDGLREEANSYDPTDTYYIASNKWKMSRQDGMWLLRAPKEASERLDNEQMQQMRAEILARIEEGIAGKEIGYTPEEIMPSTIGRPYTYLLFSTTEQRESLAFNIEAIAELDRQNVTIVLDDIFDKYDTIQQRNTQTFAQLEDRLAKLSGYGPWRFSEITSDHGDFSFSDDMTLALFVPFGTHGTSQGVLFNHGEAIQQFIDQLPESIRPAFRYVESNETGGGWLDPFAYIEIRVNNAEEFAPIIHEFERDHADTFRALVKDMALKSDAEAIAQDFISCAQGTSRETAQSEPIPGLREMEDFKAALDSYRWDPTKDPNYEPKELILNLADLGKPPEQPREEPALGPYPPSTLEYKLNLMAYEIAEARTIEQTLRAIQLKHAMEGFAKHMPVLAEHIHELLNPPEMEQSRQAMGR